VVQVGCEGHLWKQCTETVQGLQQQARDGTLSEVLMEPVVGWHVKTAGTSAHRERREVRTGRCSVLLPKCIDTHTCLK
jgi:hypothetical protein